jgi:hypothetical protein
MCIVHVHISLFSSLFLAPFCGEAEIHNSSWWHKLLHPLELTNTSYRIDKPKSDMVGLTTTPKGREIGKTWARDN